ncbi:hypothetical protein ACFYOV_31785 [Streptomyces sp. NPDC005931]|uniref:hypothetical protein n=1 Tax=Streptomyces sp. NPDC005931 TaxID=3364737 RepID=UPI0036A58A24
MKHHEQVQSQPPQSVDPADEMISPTESDVAVLAAAMRRTAHELADARASQPEFRAEMAVVLGGAVKRAEDLELFDVTKALTSDS